MTTDGLKEYKSLDLGKYEVSRYTLGEFLSLTPDDMKCTNQNSMKSQVSSYKESGGEGWLGVESRTVLKEICKSGYPEGVRKALDAIKKMSKPPRAASFRRVRIKGNKGKLNLQRFLAGSDDNLFVQRVRRKVRGRSRQMVYRLGIDLGANCGVNSDEYAWRLHCALAIANALRQAGASVEIVGYFISDGTYMDHGNPKRGHCVEVVIKEAGQPVNLDRLAIFMLSGTFRHYGFIALCTKPGRPVSGTLGQHNSNTAFASARDHDLIIGGNINCKAKATELAEWYIGFLSEEKGA